MCADQQSPAVTLQNLVPVTLPLVRRISMYRMVQIVVTICSVHLASARREIYNANSEEVAPWMYLDRVLLTAVIVSYHALVQVLVLVTASSSLATLLTVHLVVLEVPVWTAHAQPQILVGSCNFYDLVLHGLYWHDLSLRIKRIELDPTASKYLHSSCICCWSTAPLLHSRMLLSKS